MLLRASHKKARESAQGQAFEQSEDCSSIHIEEKQALGRGDVECLVYNPEGKGFIGPNISDVVALCGGRLP